MSFPNIPQKDTGLPPLLLDLAFLMVRHSMHVVGAILPEFSILVNSPRKLRRQNCMFAGLHRQLHVYARLHRELHMCARLHRELYVVPHREPYRCARLHREESIECIMDGGVVLYKTVIFQRYLRI